MSVEPIEPTAAVGDATRADHSSQQAALPPSGQDWRAFYPFASNWMTLPEGRYHYVDEGQGKPLLFVHGNPTWSFYWRELVAALRPRYRAIAVDHLGCGLSDKPRDFSYRLADHVDNLVRLIDTLDLRGITLLAHDWGGAIGLGAAAARPERFERFVLFNTGAFHGQRCPWRIRVCRAPGLGPLAVRGANAFLRAAFVMATSNPKKFRGAIRQGYLAPYGDWANRLAIQRFVEDIPLSPRHPSYDTLARIEQALLSLADRPTKFIWGMRDWCFTPAFLERFLEFFPRADVLRLPAAGHFVVEDAAEEVLAAVEDFLRSPDACIR